MQISKFILGLFLMIGLALGACSKSDPNNFGDVVGHIAEDWKKGEHKVKEGTEKVTDGQKEISKALDKLNAAAAEEATAREELAAAQKAFDDHAAAVAAGTAATDGTPVITLRENIAAAERKVKTAVDRQASVRRDMTKGEQLVKRGTDEIAAGRAEMAAAEEKFNATKTSN